MQYVLTYILSILVSIFVFWKFLKEDYSEEQVFSLAMSLCFGSLLGYGLSRFFLEEFSFWFIFGGLVASFVLFYKKSKFMFYEYLEGTVRALLFLLSLLAISYSIIEKSFVGLVLFVGVFAILVLYFFLSGSYKKFTWYKSGKIGFAGLTAAGVFFLVRGITFFIYPNAPSISGSLEPVFCGVTSFIFFTMLYNLSRK